MEHKASLRIRFRKDRKNISPTELLKRSDSITLNLFRKISFDEIKTIHTFLPKKGENEVNTNLLVRQLREQYQKIEIFVPYQKSNTTEMLAARFLNFDTLIYNKFGIPQPKEFISTFNFKNIDLILVPLLSFDLYGNRLGYGTGYYDRLIGLLRPDCIKIGLAFESCLYSVGKLPEESHDRSLNSVVTDQKVYDFK